MTGLGTIGRRPTATRLIGLAGIAALTLLIFLDSRTAQLILLPLFVAALLALPTFREKKGSWARFLVAIPIIIGGVMVPLFVFYFSALLTPSWKGAATRCGWVGSFQIGKLALTPIVLFSTAALYRLEVMGTDVRLTPWVVLGFYCGAVTSSVCQAFGFVCFGSRDVLPFLAIACYIPVWYSVRALRLGRTSDLPVLQYLKATLGMLPFWIVSWYWSRREFDALPNTRTDCFVVTAAARGHSVLVGPFVEVEHNGARVRANRQLQTFWICEQHWCINSPRTHKWFRLLYNRHGPLVARQITSCWRADLVFIALKPLECVARILCRPQEKGAASSAAPLPRVKPI